MSSKHVFRVVSRNAPESSGGVYVDIDTKHNINIPMWVLSIGKKGRNGFNSFCDHVFLQIIKVG